MATQKGRDSNPKRTIGFVALACFAFLFLSAIILPFYFSGNGIVTIFSLILSVIGLFFSFIQAYPNILPKLKFPRMRRSIVILVLLLILSTAFNASLIIKLDTPHDRAHITLPTTKPSSSVATSNPTSIKQQVAVPSYFNSDQDSLWTQMDSGAPTTGLAIINPNSGPGTSKDPNYANQVNNIEAKGIMIIGYVSTAYAGTQDHSRTLAAAEKDVDSYYNWYPNIDGIFVDQVSTDCSSLNLYYKPLYDYIKAKGGVAEVVLDPGTTTSECYISAGDIIVNFEDTFSNYANWVPDSWVTRYSPSRFWQIIISTSVANLPLAIAYSKSRDAGWVYVTDGGGDNPFNTLPSYWSKELSLVSR